MSTQSNCIDVEPLDSVMQGFEDRGFEDRGFKDRGLKDRGFKDGGFEISDQ
jgi:hypothetical protein